MTRRPAAFDLGIIALLALLAYAPALSLPFIEDDYGNIAYTFDYGPFTPVFRARATSYWLISGLWKAFGRAPAPFHAASLLLHILNCWLVYALVEHAFADVDIARFAGAFFAVHEGHQEAIMWFSACNELLQFFFGAAALLLFLRGRTLASAACFALALVSKESAVIWLPLFFLVGPDRRRAAARLLPHAALTALAVAAVWATRTYSFRFADGSFSLQAPFWITWPRNFARVLWPWGWMALAALAWWRESKIWKPALAWIGIALVPYSFLTYSTQIPSRQTYLTGVGMALLVGTALALLRPRPRLLAAAATMILVVNVGYLWTKKRSQFIERAQPTEQLIHLARQTQGPIWVECFPRNHFIAQTAVRIAAGRSPDTLVWSRQEALERGAAVTFCYKGSR